MDSLGLERVGCGWGLLRKGQRTMFSDAKNFLYPDCESDTTEYNCGKYQNVTFKWANCTVCKLYPQKVA